MRWTYLLMLVPTLSDLLEAGRLPTHPGEIAADLILTALVGVGAWGICRQHDRLKALAERDFLTGLYNVRTFDQDLDRELHRCERTGGPLVLLFIDLDGFKGVNDRLGHREGDRLLAGVGRVLSGSLRRGVDRAYRIGGDEFAVLLPGSDPGGASEFAARLRAAVNEDPPGLARAGAGLSIGAASWTPGRTANEMLREADSRMYEAKRSGGSTSPARG